MDARMGMMVRKCVMIVILVMIAASFVGVEGVVD